MKNWKLISWLAILVWIASGIYGVIFNISYIDEAKYLIKGWLMMTGKVSYYQTGEFFYQHMPGGWLWYGLGQKIFGPSLLVGRIQSFLVGLAILGSSFILGKRLGGKKGGIITLAMLSLGPVTALYYSAAVPQSLLALVFVWSFIFLYDGLVGKQTNKLLLATVFFSLLLVIRENFLFSLIIYWGFLAVALRGSAKKLLSHVLVTVAVLGMFIIPGYPGTINVFKNFPGISQLLPVSATEQQVLSLYWKEDLQSLGLQLRALREFGIIFHAWFLTIGWLIFGQLKKGLAKLKLGGNRSEIYWQFLLGMVMFNFLIHAYAAFKLSPRAIISYLAYIAPLIAVILAKLVTETLKDKKMEKRLMATYLALIIIAPVGLRFARIFAIPSRQADLMQINMAKEKLMPLVEGRQNIVWISEPISLYMAGRVSYYPLINHINFYKPSNDTEVVKNLGFWNETIMADWLSDADLLVLEENKLRLLEDSDQGKSLAAYLRQRASTDFVLLEKREDIWPGEYLFYLPKP